MLDMRDLLQRHLVGGSEPQLIINPEITVPQQIIEGSGFRRSTTSQDSVRIWQGPQPSPCMSLHVIAYLHARFAR
jgi:hypothetical protein